MTAVRLCCLGCGDSEQSKLEAAIEQEHQHEAALEPAAPEVDSEAESNAPVEVVEAPARSLDEIAEATLVEVLKDNGWHGG